MSDFPYQGLAWKRVCVAEAKAARDQAVPLKEYMAQLEALFNLTKSFSKFPNVAFDDIDKHHMACTTAKVKPPAAMGANLVVKKVECLLSENKIMEAWKLLSIVPQPDMS